MLTKRSLSLVSRARLVGPALGLLLVAGCGPDGSGTPVACTGDQVCPPPSTAISWAAQLWPSSSDGSSQQNPLVPQEFERLTFDGRGMAALRYRAPVLAHGTVINAETLPLPLVHARVLALLPTVISGQNPLSFNTLTTDKPAGQWSLRLPVPEHPTAQPYRFWVGFDEVAQSSLYPPVWRDQAVGSDLEVALSMRAATSLAIVSGKIINPLGDGVGGLTVQVLDANNQIVSSTAVSTAATGEADPLAGKYQLLVDPTLAVDTQAALRVVVRPGSVNSTLPTLEVPLQPPRAGAVARVDFAFPSQRTPVTFQLPVRGVGTSGTAMAVVGAHVQAQVQLQDPMTQKLGVRATYTATVDTDAQGIARLTLVPANSGGANLVYKVAVVSPTITPFSSLQQEVQVGPNEGLLAALSLPLRAQLLGRLLDATGQPVPNAQVVAQQIASGSVSPSPFGSMSTDVAGPQTTTDQDGRFAMRVDAGDYDLDLVPVPGTQPRSSLDNQRIGTADVDVGDVRLPRITLGQLVVTRPGGSPAAQTKVRVFQLPDTTPRFGLACVPSLPCSQVAKLRAEAFTDRNGLAQFLLPDSTPLTQLPAR